MSKGVSKEVEEGKVCAILSYLLIGIIWYFVDEKMKKNDFAKFHVKQGLILLIASVAVNILWHILWAILFFLGWWFFEIISLVILVLAIMGIIAAANGQKKELPVIGQFAKSLTF